MDIPDEVIVWKFGNLPGNLRAENNYINNQGYNCLCRTNEQFLVWEKGQLSIKLAFASSPQNKFHFHRPDGQESEILTGEPVAMAIGMGEAYLYYGKQTVGINLKWSDGPLYEWRIYLPGGEKGKPVPTGTPCALVNVKVDPDPDFLVCLEKHMPRVVDLGWTTSPTWLQSYVNAAKRINAIRKEII